MKRILAFLLTTVCVFLSGMTCYAGNTTLDRENNQTEVDVYAKSVGEKSGYSAPVADGSSSVVTDDGTEIVVSGVPDGVLTLYVVPIPKSETEAWNWFEKCMEGKGTDIRPYDIYFLDAKGNRINANGVTITVTLPVSYENPVVYSVTTDGRVTELRAVVNDGRIIFTADGSNYYVFADRVKSGNSAQTGVNGSSPKTDDSFNLWIWTVLLFISGAGLIWSLLEKQKRNEIKS